MKYLWLIPANHKTAIPLIAIRIEVGTRDIKENQVVVVRRDNKEKISISFNEINKKTQELLKLIQENLYAQAKLFRDQNTHKVKSYDEFKKIIKSGGFVRCGWRWQWSCWDWFWKG